MTRMEFIENLKDKKWEQITALEKIRIKSIVDELNEMLLEFSGQLFVLDKNRPYESFKRALEILKNIIILENHKKNSKIPSTIDKWFKTDLYEEWNLKAALNPESEKSSKKVVSTEKGRDSIVEDREEDILTVIEEDIEKKIRQSLEKDVFKLRHINGKELEDIVNRYLPEIVKARKRSVSFEKIAFILSFYYKGVINRENLSKAVKKVTPEFS